MAKLSRLAGSTSHMLEILIQDSSSTTGAGLTGLTSASAGLTCYYKRNTGTASVAVTLTTITTLGTYVSGGIKEVDVANMPGVYEFHPPDAAYASGAKSVVFLLKGAANMAPVPIEVELTAVDNQDAAAFGLSRLDAAVTTRSTFAAGGNVNASQFGGQTVTAAAPITVLASVGTATTNTAQTGDAFARLGAPTGASIAADIQTRSTYAGGAVASVTAGVTVTTNNDKTGYSLSVAPPTAAQIATAVLTDTGDNTTTGTPGKILAQLAGAFTGTTSVYTSAALANAPSGTGASAATIATAVWQDLLASSDFSTVGSVGALVKANLDATVSSRNAGAVNLNLSQTLNAARNLDTVADTAYTLNDLAHCAIAAAIGQKDNSTAASMVLATSFTHTVLRTQTVTLATPGATVPVKVS